MNPPPNSNAAELSNRAMHMLGLHSQPFRDRPAGNEYFSDPVIQMQLNLLQHNLKFSDMLQILKGDAGCGKTALIIQMLANANDEFQIFVARGEPSLTATQILKGMLKIFQQPLPDDSELCLELLTGYLKIRLEKNLSSVLIIENAHEIEVVSLNQLFEYTDKINETLEGELRILLVADSEIDSILSELTSKQLSEGRFFVSNARTLDLPRTGNYLEYRLRKAGFVGKLPFSDKQLADLYKNTEGIPQKVDAVAASMLNRKPGQRSIVARLRKLPLQLINRGATALVIIGLLLFLIGQISDQTPATDDAGLQTRVELVPTVIAIDPPKTDKPITVKPVLETAPTALQSTESATESQAVGESSTEDRAATIKLLSEADSPSNPIFVGSHDVTIFGSDKNSTGTQTTEKPGLEKTEAKKVEPKKSMQQPLPVKPRAPTKSEIWFLAQNSSTYTIQLLATYDMVELSRYAQTNKIESRTTLFETSRNERRWYVLTYGLYSSAEVAREVAAKLPAALRRNKPWIRSTKSVQQAIHRRQP